MFSGCVAGDALAELWGVESETVSRNGKDTQGRKAWTESAVRICSTTAVLPLISV